MNPVGLTFRICTIGNSVVGGGGLCVFVCVLKAARMCVFGYVGRHSLHGRELWVVCDSELGLCV